MYHISICKIRTRIPLVRMVYIHELDRISYEKDRLTCQRLLWEVRDRKYYRIIEYPIQVALFGKELESPSPYIADTVCGTSFRADCGETCEDLRFYPNFSKKMGRSQVWYVLGDFEFSKSSSTLGMDNTISVSASIIT
jgi:hypothetical protein